MKNGTIILAVAVILNCFLFFAIGYTANEAPTRIETVVVHDTVHHYTHTRDTIFFDTNVDTEEPIPQKGTWMSDVPHGMVGYYGDILVQDGVLMTLHHCECEEKYYIIVPLASVLDSTRYRLMKAAVKGGKWEKFTNPYNLRLEGM